MNDFKRYENQLQQLQLTATEEEFLSAVTAYIVNHMADGRLSVDDIADAFGMHNAKLRRRIQTITGLTPARFLTTIRMNHAIEMLDRWPQYNITQIATECGYADLSHFSHAFKRVFDINPTQYVEHLPTDSTYRLPEQ